MNNVYIKLVSLLMVVINLAVGVNLKSVGEIYERLTDDMDTSICEYSIKGSCYLDDVSDNGVNEKVNLLKANLERYIGQVSLERDGENNYNIIFLNSGYSGSIEILPYKSQKMFIVILDMLGGGMDVKEIKRLEDDFTKALSTISSNVEYSLSIKSKIFGNTMDEVKEKVKKELYRCGSKDVEIAKISNGYSIVADTGINREIKVLNKDIDLQCAVVKYSSGCYLIVGTPEILITY